MSLIALNLVDLWGGYHIYIYAYVHAFVQITYIDFHICNIQRSNIYTHMYSYACIYIYIYISREYMINNYIHVDSLGISFT